MISICIPSYNRPFELIRLLNSIQNQQGDFEIIIAEDNAPKRDQVVAAVNDFIRENPKLTVHLFLNETNLGYDGNLKNLIRISKGEYCIFMGDDDLMKEGSISRIQDAIKKHPDIGFILRSWDEIDKDGNLTLTQKYFAKSQLFPPGENTVVNFFRKSVFISGLVVHRQTALKFETDKVDGKLLYQLYLSANILLDKPGYYISDTIATHIKGGEHFFGSSEKEKGKFEPKKLTVEHSLNFMQGFIDIAKLIDKERETSLETKIITDLSKYSYGFLVIQRKNGLKIFINYIIGLKKMGYGKTLYFYLFIILLSVLGNKFTEILISFIKSKMQSIPKY